jgi:uncharacterized protein YfaT (DUF1175 family)
MKIRLRIPSETLCFRNWLFWIADSRVRWDGPHILWRERFYRVLGLEISYEYKESD